MAKKSGFEKAQASVLKALRNFEKTVVGMAGFEQPAKRKKAKKKAKSLNKRTTRKSGAR